jgi:hypothetical protein
MNDDALKKLWQEQKIESGPFPPDREQIALVRRKMKKFARGIFWRDMRELGAGIFVVLFFVHALFHIHAALAQAGCWIVILSAIFIDAKLIHARRRVPAPNPAASLRETLRTEIQRVEVQIRLLRSVLWWYLLPLIVGADLFFVGCNRDPVDDAVYLSTTAAVSAFIYWLNQYAVKKHLVPMKTELETLLDEPR